MLPGYTCTSGPTELKRVYIDGKRYVLVGPTVYEPAEDSWLTVECLARVANECEIVIDVGTGSGVVAVSVTRPVYRIAIDLNPCALMSARASFEVNGVAGLTDVVQCDLATCVRGSPSACLVFNAPYLPPGEADDLAWTGGLPILERFVESMPEPRCTVLTFSSLTGEGVWRLIERLERLGFQLRCRLNRHYFFEDIVSVALCRSAGHA